jgi:hypothetical protein
VTWSSLCTGLELDTYGEVSFDRVTVERAQLS